MRRNTLSAQTIEIMRKKYLNGRSIEWCAIYFGVSYGQARKHLKLISRRYSAIR